MQPGYQPGYQSQPIPNNMGMAILALILFWPLGLVAIINAGKVNGLAQQGNYQGAQTALAESKRWTKYALITAGVFYAISIVCGLGSFIILGGALATSGS